MADATTRHRSGGLHRHPGGDRSASSSCGQAGGRPDRPGPARRGHRHPRRRVRLRPHLRPGRRGRRRRRPSTSRATCRSSCPPASIEQLTGATLDVPRRRRAGLVLRNPNRPDPLAGKRPRAHRHDRRAGRAAARASRSTRRSPPTAASPSSKGVEDDKVYVTMGGGCQGCAVSAMTLRDGIARSITRRRSPRSPRSSTPPTTTPARTPSTADHNDAAVGDVQLHRREVDPTTCRLP